MFVVKKESGFKKKHASKYGLKVSARAAHSSKATSVMCQFYSIFGREAKPGCRRKPNTRAKVFQKFQTKFYTSHIEGQHPRKWAEYQELHTEEPRIAFVARSARLESEGSQVLSSLANVSQRVPTLLQTANATNENDDVDSVVEVMGVLSYSCNTQTLLLQKHFLALEKSRGFLTDILREYQELLRRLRSFASECVTLVDDAFIESENVSVDEMAIVTFPLQLQEWMETVLAMFEHEVLRKSRLVVDLEYSDTGRLSSVSKQWSVKGAMSNVDNDYVQNGLQLPQAKVSSVSQLDSDTSKSKNKKKKKNKAKK
ncbi:hypothetical protein PHMEG_00011803 [Phytophthora megakarya]|uniref:Uncharacterized protein n=1 Tax=Phytophthora megakarya TaxID=4795 RepID=A0A225WBC7_9STRA|nr:hypothetical protein PHMEG_00011803 [Phytophthora megakarya]